MRLVSVCGFVWSSFVRLKPESQNVVHVNGLRPLCLLLHSNSIERQYHDRLSLQHGEVFFVLPKAKIEEEFINILFQKFFTVDGCCL